MAGTVKTNAVQLGDSSTATQNLTIRTNVDGTFTLARGNVGATTQDILTIDSSGNIAQPGMQAWSVYTPTVTSGSGTITTVGFVYGRYKQIGKLLFLNLQLSITTNGTAAGWIAATLPAGITTGPLYQAVSGRECAATGKMQQAMFSPSSTACQILNYDNTYPASNGSLHVITGILEIA